MTKVYARVSTQLSNVTIKVNGAPGSENPPTFDKTATEILLGSSVPVTMAAYVKQTDGRTGSTNVFQREYGLIDNYSYKPQFYANPTLLTSGSIDTYTSIGVVAFGNITSYTTNALRAEKLSDIVANPSNLISASSPFSYIESDGTKSIYNSTVYYPSYFWTSYDINMKFKIDLRVLSAEVLEGDTAVFSAVIDSPIPEGAESIKVELIPNAVDKNITSDDALRNSQYETDWKIKTTNDVTLEGGKYYVTFNPGDKTKTVQIETLSDKQIEPDEIFSIGLGDATSKDVSITTIVDKSVSFGKIVNDDLSSNFTNAIIQADSSFAPSDQRYIDLLKKDILAALENISNKIPGGLPLLNIFIANKDISSLLALADTRSVKVYNSKTSEETNIPSALYKYTFGKEAPGPVVGAYDGYIVVNSKFLPQIYNGLVDRSDLGESANLSTKYSYDVTTVMTHELMHLLGFGISEENSPWNLLTNKINPAFAGPRAGTVVLTTGGEGHAGSHVAFTGDREAMLPGYSGPNNIPSDLDIKILQDIGYSKDRMKDDIYYFINKPVASRAHTDLNGDGISDILFQQGSSVVSWGIQNGLVQNAADLGGAGSYRVAATGDITGDGTSDVLFQDGSSIVAWQVQNGQVQASAGIGNAGSYQLVASGDFNGDSTADVLFQQGGSIVAWRMQNGQVQSSTGLGNAGGYQVAGTGDINGDGTDDIVFQDGASVVAWIMGNGQVQSLANLGNAGDYRVAGVGDLNGDGRADLVFQNGASVVDWIMGSNGQVQSANTLGNAGGYAVSGVGDYTGDGTADVLFQHGASVVGWGVQNGQVQSLLNLGNAGTYTAVA